MWAVDRRSGGRLDCYVAYALSFSDSVLCAPSPSLALLDLIRSGFETNHIQLNAMSLASFSE